MRIEVHELSPDRPGLLDSLARIRAETDAELNPGDPPPPPPELAADLFVTSLRAETCGWLATVDGEPAGDLVVELELAEANRHLASADWFAVRPSFRRRGVADALLRTALPVLAAAGRTSLVVWVPELDGDPGGRYARRLGLEPKMSERCSRVRVAALDDRLLEQWRAAPAARAAGYRLVTFGGRCPDELLDPYVAAHSAMEDMPTDDLDWTIPRMTPELLRSLEDRWAAQGRVLVRTLALAPDGTGAGISELFVSSHRPELVRQGDTGVTAAHRGHGLGRWLKAENLAAARRRTPSMEVIETHNAQSNPWMLDINMAMGFRPHVILEGHQGSLDGALAALS